jgi:hypothetical protein
MHEISGVMTPACVAALKKAKRKGSPKGCVVILNEYKLQRGEEGDTTAVCIDANEGAGAEWCGPLHSQDSASRSRRSAT